MLLKMSWYQYTLTKICWDHPMLLSAYFHSITENCMCSLQGSSAFVYGWVAFADRLSNGIAVKIVQQFLPLQQSRYHTFDHNNIIMIVSDTNFITTMSSNVQVARLLSVCTDRTSLCWSCTWSVHYLINAVC